MRKVKSYQKKLMASPFYWLCKDYDLRKAESVFMLLLLPGAVQDFILL